MSLTVTIAGSPVTIFEKSLSIEDALDQRTVVSFDVRDDTGNVRFKTGQPVSIVDSSLGTLFTGFVFDPSEANIYPNATNRVTVTCMDNHFLADKRANTNSYEFQNSYAGDIFAYLLNGPLSSEGLNAALAYKRTATQADFAAGTLTNAVATTNVKDGDLEIASAGTTISYTEQTLSDWNNGSMLNMQGSNNGLTLASTQAIALSGSCEQANNNNFVYIDIWYTGLTIASGYSLVYDIWVSSTSPKIMAGVDGICSDGTSIRDFTSGTNAYIVDQQGLRAHPGTDLSGYANDQWYTRTISLSAMAGKSLQTMSVALEGDAQGNYKAWFRHIKIVNGSGTTVATIFETTQTLYLLAGINGYSNVSCGPTTVYEKTGSRVYNGIPMSSAGVLRQSLISWNATLPLLPTTPTPSSGAATVGVSVTPTVATTSSTASQANGSFEFDVSWDAGQTWLVATNHSAIPGLPPGASLSGQTLLLRQYMALGNDPTVTPVLLNDTVTIVPSYAPSGTKTDLHSFYGYSTGFPSPWVKNSVIVSSGNALTLSGTTRNWDNADYSSQTLYGTGGPYQEVIAKQFAIGNTGNGVDVRSRFDFAGNTWQNFVLDVDIYVNTSGNYSFVYRTTGWQNANNTHAYSVDLTPTAIILGRGTNTSSGSGAYTQIQNVALSLSTGNWHHLQLNINGSSHVAILDGVEYINATDSTFTAAGYVGARFYNVSGNQATAFFDNFGISTNRNLTGSAVLTQAITIVPNFVQNSVVVWNETVPSGTSITIQASFGGGPTNTLTNGGQLPSLTYGSNPSGFNLVITVTLTASSAGILPSLNSLSFWVVAQLNAQGTWVSPALSLSNVANAGSTSVAWDAVLPNNYTSIQVSTSFDNINWSTVLASGNVISGINAQPSPTDDTFSANTSANYTSTNYASGANATWTFDTTNSRITATGGNNALYELSATPLLSAQLGSYLIDIDQADDAGLVCCYASTSAFYFLSIRDNSSSKGSPQIQLYKRSGGTNTQLGSTAVINFVRGTPHRFVLTIASGGGMTVSMDGVTLITATDGSLLAAGTIGLRASGTARFYQLRAQPVGDNLNGKLLYTRAVLYTTDPTVTPQLLDITTSVRSPNIASGVLIPTTAYYLKLCSAVFDDLKNQSGLYWWYIDKNRVPYFQPYTSTLSPWILSSSDVLVKSLTVDNTADTYRNTEWVQGGVDTTQVITETRYGDGVTQAWTMSYPLAGVPQITLTDPTIHLDGQTATVGIRGTDTGKQFYYQQGNNTISQDTSATPPGLSETITFSYYGQIPVIGYYQDTAEVARRAALDGTSGIVEDVVSVPSIINKAAANLYAQQLVQRFEITGGDVQFKTLRQGLAPGQLLTAFIPQHGILDQTYLVLRVKTTVFTVSGGNLQYSYEAETSAGPNLGNYMYFLK